jgi:hypothetical protein
MNSFCTVCTFDNGHHGRALISITFRRMTSNILKRQGHFIYLFIFFQFDSITTMILFKLNIRNEIIFFTLLTFWCERASRRANPLVRR